MGFTNVRWKRKVHYGLPSPVVVNVSQTVAEKVGDEVVERVVRVPVDLCSKEAAKSLPTLAEYSLKNLLEAGVPLEQINPSNLLTPTDLAFGSAHAEAVGSKILDSIETDVPVVEPSNSAE